MADGVVLGVGGNITGIAGFGRGWRRRKQPAAESELLGAVAVREEAIVADAVEPVRQNMEQEPADELANAEPHHLDLVAAVVAVVLPSEAYVIGFKLDQAAVGDGDAMGVAGEIGEHLRRTGERLLGIHDPLLLAEGRKVGPECGSIRWSGQVGKESYLARDMQRDEALKEQEPEQPREHAYRQEEVGPTGYPAGGVRRDAAAGDDAMDVRVMAEVLAPGMQHRGDADLGAEMLRVGRDRGEHLGRCGEKQTVDRGLVR